MKNSKKNMEKRVNLKNKIADVSIILTTYNGSKYIDEQIESIYKQVLHPKEILVIDDESTDGTVKQLSRLKKSCPEDIAFQIIENKHNIGYIANFIKGISLAHGKYIFLSDQDDIWLSNKVLSMYSMLEEHPEIVAIHTNTSLIDEHGTVIKKNMQQYRGGVRKIDMNHFIQKVNYPGMALAFRTKKIREQLLDISSKDIKLPTHDWTICYIACLMDGFYVSEETLTYRRYTGSNVALNIEKKRLSDIDQRIQGINLYKRYYSFIINLQRIYPNKRHLRNANLYLKNANNRITYLKKNAIRLAVMNIINVKFYPSKKSFIGDILLLIRYKKLFRK